MQTFVNSAYVWLAVDRNRNKIIKIKVTESRDSACYLHIAREIEEDYNVNILCTDAYPVYAQYNLGGRHVVTKSETSLVESKNSIIRHYLARFNRKTKRYSKAIDMIENSLLMLFHSRDELLTTNV